MSYLLIWLWPGHKKLKGLLGAGVAKNTWKPAWIVAKISFPSGRIGAYDIGRRENFQQSRDMKINNSKYYFNITGKSIKNQNYICNRLEFYLPVAYICVLEQNN